MNKPISAENFVVRMKVISKMKDVEERHVKADDLLCKLLKQLGYAEGIKIYESMEAWFA